MAVSGEQALPDEIRNPESLICLYTTAGTATHTAAS
ncbi:Uncharacterised protein [Mycobacterium tuberculosis]|nr:Uncharacterised protein [Mycobacterium tuberculosis]